MRIISPKLKKLFRPILEKKEILLLLKRIIIIKNNIWTINNELECDIKVKCSKSRDASLKQ